MTFIQTTTKTISRLYLKQTLLLFQQAIQTETVGSRTKHISKQTIRSK